MAEFPAPKREQVSHRRKAEQEGVSTRTLDRWADDGRMEPPFYINGRKYHWADSRPRHDKAATATKARKELAARRGLRGERGRFQRPEQLED